MCCILADSRDSGEMVGPGLERFGMRSSGDPEAPEVCDLRRLRGIGVTWGRAHMSEQLP